ncbi:hypothetical protein EDF88_4530 [Buttiauxella sp. BIGb0552]|nr:hypothetical protein EDF88_4530 [Buttiauxella sp. BIGb0552]
MTTETEKELSNIVMFPVKDADPLEMVGYVYEKPIGAVIQACSSTRRSACVVARPVTERMLIKTPLVGKLWHCCSR